MRSGLLRKKAIQTAFHIMNRTGDIRQKQNAGLVILAAILIGLWGPVNGQDRSEVPEKVRVNLHEGLEASYTEELEQTAEYILNAINSYYLTGEWELPARVVHNEGVEEQLTGLLEDDKWKVPAEEITTFIRRKDEKFKVGGLILEADTAETSRYEELLLIFDEQAVLKKVRLQEDSFNIIPVIGWNEPVPSEKESRVKKVLKDLQKFYNDQDVAALSDLIGRDALVVTGYAFEESERMLYQQHDGNSYLSFLERLMVYDAELDVQFDEVEVLGHSHDENLYGIRANQSWQAKNYSDDGAVFLLVDLDSSDQPDIRVRSWDVELKKFIPESETFSEVLFEIEPKVSIEEPEPDPEPEPETEPEPMYLQLAQKQVFDHDSQKDKDMVSEFGVTEGSIQFMVDDDKADQLKKWFKSNAFSIEGVSTDQEKITAGEGYINIPFHDQNASKGTQETDVVIVFDGMDDIEPFQAGATIFLQRMNQFEVSWAEDEQTEPLEKPDKYGYLKIQSEADSLNTILMTTSEDTLSKHAQTESIKEHRLLEGSYVLDWKQSVKDPQLKEIEIGVNDTTRVTVETKTDPRITRRAKYIAGGALLVVTGAILTLTGDRGASEPEIPEPPPRP